MKLFDKRFKSLKPRKPTPWDVNVGKALDRRVKVAKSEYGNIKYLYNTSGWTAKKIGRKYGVSESTIYLILDAKKLAAKKRYDRLYAIDHPYTESKRKSAEVTRAYKRKLLAKKHKAIKLAKKK